MSPHANLDDWVGRPLPDVTLVADDASPFALGARAGVGPQVLFFYIRNGTPG